MGNLHSVAKALHAVGASASIVREVPRHGKLILPGVGAFGAAMQALQPHLEGIRSLADQGDPLLGICLGQQLLFDSSEEMGAHDGIGIIPGDVRYLPRDRGLKVPHVGWTPLQIKVPKPLLAGIADGDFVYFVHSLATHCADPADVAAIAEYGVPFPAAIQRDNVWGCQFHPEKSGAVGLRIIQNFAKC